MCTECNKNELGDEFHYILECPFFEQDRKIYIPKYYYSRPHVLKYKLLFSSKLKSELIKLRELIKFFKSIIFILINHIPTVQRRHKYTYNKYRIDINIYTVYTTKTWV